MQGFGIQLCCIAAAPKHKCCQTSIRDVQRWVCFGWLGVFCREGVFLVCLFCSCFFFGGGGGGGGGVFVFGFNGVDSLSVLFTIVLLFS